MPSIIVNNKSYEVKDGQNLLQACLSLGFNIPYFCWHPALGSVGACRQCAVKQFRDDKDTQGRLVMSCMTPAANNTIISTEDKQARAFRADVVEALMTDHPHDCPVCDEGGECHLQDMTMMTGHTYRKYRFKKRTFRNQNLGPFINHEMNRCIQCYRCVRYYRDYAGGHDLNAFSAHNHVYFGRHEDGTLENEFSGNLVEICPTGVFTDKTLKKHFTRRWDLQTSPSVCVHCSVGCNTTPGERYGELRRIRNRYNGEVNGYFLCDRGRYGYEFVNDPLLVRMPVTKDTLPLDTTEATERDEIDFTREVLRHAGRILLEHGTRLIGIGSPAASLECNFALRALVGPERFFSGMPAHEHSLMQSIKNILQRGPAPAPCLRDLAEADAVLILGEDVTNVAPLMALQLRQSVRNVPMATAEKIGVPEWNDLAVRVAVQDAKGPFFVVTPFDDRLDDIATVTWRGQPDQIAQLGHAIANLLDSDAPKPGGLPEDLIGLAGQIAGALRNAKKPLIVSGPSLGSEAIIKAAANIAWALCAGERNAHLCYTAMECNSMGAALMGGRPIDEAFALAESGAADVLVICENDLYRRASRQDVDALFSNVKHCIVLAHTPDETTARADVLLPAGTFPEGDGTMVNYEGRAQRFFQVFVPQGEILESWRWLHYLRAAAGRADSQEDPNLDEVLEEMAVALPVFRDVKDIAPSARFRIAGQKIPRQTHRASGRTAMHAHINVSENRIQEDPDSSLAFTMEGYLQNTPASMVSSFWAPGWNSPQAVMKFQEEIGGALRGGDPGLRLIEPPASGDIPYLKNSSSTQPQSICISPLDTRGGHGGVAPGVNSLFIPIPLYHIYGSEPLSMRAPAVAQRAPKPYIALHPDDAAALSAGDGSEVTIEIDGTPQTLQVIARADIPRGFAGVPMGLPHMPFLQLQPSTTQLAEVHS